MPTPCAPIRSFARLPGERDLCSQSTISRLKNLPDRRMLLRMARAMIGLYCASFAQVPKRITLDIDDTFDAVHGGQQLRLFNAHYDEYGFQPIVVFDGAGRFVAAVLRPARRPNGREIAAHLRRLIRELRTHWPRVKILICGASHYCAPEVLDLCRARGVDFVPGLAGNATLRRHVTTLEQSTIARADQNSSTKVRRSRSSTTPWDFGPGLPARGDGGFRCRLRGLGARASRPRRLRPLRSADASAPLAAAWSPWAARSASRVRLSSVAAGMAGSGGRRDAWP